MACRVLANVFEGNGDTALNKVSDNKYAMSAVATSIFTYGVGALCLGPFGFAGMCITQIVACGACRVAADKIAENIIAEIAPKVQSFNQQVDDASPDLDKLRSLLIDIGNSLATNQIEPLIDKFFDTVIKNGRFSWEIPNNLTPIMEKFGSQLSVVLLAKVVTTLTNGNYRNLEELKIAAMALKILSSQLPNQKLLPLINNFYTQAVRLWQSDREKLIVGLLNDIGTILPHDFLKKVFDDAVANKDQQVAEKSLSLLKSAQLPQNEIKHLEVELLVLTNRKQFKESMGRANDYSCWNRKDALQKAANALTALAPHIQADELESLAAELIGARWGYHEDSELFTSTINQISVFLQPNQLQALTLQLFTRVMRLESYKRYNQATFVLEQLGKYLPEDILEARIKEIIDHALTQERDESYRYIESYRSHPEHIAQSLEKLKDKISKAMLNRLAVYAFNKLIAKKHVGYVKKLLEAVGDKLDDATIQPMLQQLFDNSLDENNDRLSDAEFVVEKFGARLPNKHQYVIRFLDASLKDSNRYNNYEHIKQFSSELTDGELEHYITSHAEQYGDYYVNDLCDKDLQLSPDRKARIKQKLATASTMHRFYDNLRDAQQYSWYFENALEKLIEIKDKVSSEKLNRLVERYLVALTTHLAKCERNYTFENDCQKYLTPLFIGDNTVTSQVSPELLVNPLELLLESQHNSPETAERALNILLSVRDNMPPQDWQGLAEAFIFSATNKGYVEQALSVLLIIDLPNEIKKVCFAQIIENSRAEYILDLVKKANDTLSISGVIDANLVMIAYNKILNGKYYYMHHVETLLEKYGNTLDPKIKHQLQQKAKIIFLKAKFYSNYSMGQTFDDYRTEQAQNALAELKQLALKDEYADLISKEECAHMSIQFAQLSIKFALAKNDMNMAGKAFEALQDGINDGAIDVDQLPNSFQFEFPETINLDLWFNHFNNPVSGSILTKINALTNPQLKLYLMRVVVDYLGRLTKEQLTPLIASLKDILLNNFYIVDAQINSFLQYACIDITVSQAMVSPINFSINEMEFINNYLLSLPPSSRQSFMLQKNHFFIQLLYQGLTSSNDSIKPQAIRLASVYENIPEVKACLEKMGHDRVYEPEEDDLPMQVNLIITINDPSMLQGITHICVEGNYLARFLYQRQVAPGMSVEWSHVSYLQYMNPGVNNPIGANIDLAAVFNQVLIFQANYQRSLQGSRFNNFMNLLFNNNRFFDKFIDAAKVRSLPLGDKLCGPDQQGQLAAIFNQFYLPSDEALSSTEQLKNTTFKQEHLPALYEVFGYTTNTGNTQKAELLLSLAELFARYSSSSIFGHEHESPEAIRRYSYALMKTAHELDGSVVILANFTDWQNKLLGLSGAFTCSAMIADSMKGANNSQVRNVIIPPKWQ